MATRKKKYPKIKVGTPKASEILADLHITPAEMRRVRRIVDDVMRKQDKEAAKTFRAAAK